jgi:hypothetical protein
MRAGPLSDPKVISLLNRYFVPVYISNEDYHGKPPAVPPEEAQAHQRIYREALQEKRPAGSVCVYLVAPDGKGLDSLIVSDAARPGQLQKLLEAAVAKLGTTEGKPLVPPAAQSAAPKAEPGSLVCHLVARVDHRGSWGEFPSENWVVLRPEDQAAFVPPGAADAGATWEIDRQAAARLLTYFYPQTETCNCALDAVEGGPHQHRIEQLALKGRVVSVQGETVLARLEGGVKIKHTFYPKRDDDNRAEATVLGYVEFDRGKKEVRSLRLVTEKATYGRFGFGVAVRSLP